MYSEIGHQMNYVQYNNNNNNKNYNNNYKLCDVNLFQLMRLFSSGCLKVMKMINLR
jgi:hypothetical protein